MSGQARVLVTGSRTWTDWNTIHAALLDVRLRFGTAVLVHGDAAGADRLAARIWSSWGLPVEPHPARWNEAGRAAGFLRNQHMVDLGADVCLAFIRNGSRGASHTARIATQAGIPTTRFEPGHLDLLQRVIRTIRGEGYAVIGPAERIYRVDAANRLNPDLVPVAETAIVRGLLANGNAQLGMRQTFQCGRYSGPGRLVIAGNTTKGVFT